MNALEGVLTGIQAEVQRCSQRLEGRDVLPDRIRVTLAVRDFGRWSPVLPQVTAELGEGLVEWARRRGSEWYGGRGPALEVELTETAGIRVAAEFSGGTSRDTVMVEPATHRTGQG